MLGNEKFMTLVSLLMLAVIIVSACAAPTPQGEVTREVEVEVTREVEAVVTATPEPEADAAVREQCGFDVVIGHNGATVTMNPILAADTDALWMTDMLFDSLVELDPVTLEPRPRLAESWEISEDGMVYTFYLVDADVRWHDGEPFSVQDIEFTLMEILKPTYAGAFQARFADLEGADRVIGGEADSLEGFRVIDDDTVQFRLNNPNAAFLSVALVDLKFLPMHLLAGKEITNAMPYSQAPIGTGPYRFRSWVKGVSEVIEWNLDYWGEVPCAKTITKLIVPDQMSLASALESGDIDVTMHAPPTEWPRLAEAETVQVLDQPSRSTELLWFNMTHPILHDQKVRQAIAHAIDREAFSTYVMHGAVAPVTQYIPEAGWAYDPEAKLPDYNPERAKELLAQAGYPDGFEIKLSTNAGNAYRAAAVEYIQGELAKVGIDVEIRMEEWITFYGAVQQGEFEMKFRNEDAGIPDPATISEVFHTDGSVNFIQFSDPQVDIWLDEAGVVVDREQRKEYYRQVTEVLNNDLPCLPFFARPFQLGVNAKFQNVVPSVLWNFAGVQNWRLVEE